MNYEVNPFQDYESITVDELKDQANSLLNLVTEEQRPLRVCMNNGKEFLLFPQDLLAPICDSDFRLILLSAMRYAMGRNTCMPMVVADYIKRHIQLLDDKFLVLAADEIRRHLEDYAEHEPNPNLWHDLLGALETSRESVPLVRQGRLGLARPAESPRFECQSKNIHDKITTKVNSVSLAGRRCFPLFRCAFP